MLYIIIQVPSFVFTEEYQREFLEQYHKAFDTLSSEFLVGEMPWNFADFMTVQGMVLFQNHNFLKM
jgi:beta-glucuronidase